MTQVMAGTTALFRDRDLFIHDGKKLRRFRISAPIQAVLFVVLLGLVGWASFATARLVTRPRSTMAAATEMPSHRGSTRKSNATCEKFAPPVAPDNVLIGSASTLPPVAGSIRGAMFHAIRSPMHIARAEGNTTKASPLVWPAPK